ncbi:MAG: acetoacetate decarboxylase family protein [Bdellovibrio sp.]|nr:acetoacetate decarboxylase family protein [Bdellovibrio sp.]
MSASKFFSKVVQTEMPYGDYIFKSPFFIRDADVIGAFFLCDYEKAQALTAPHHRPLKLPFKKTLLAVNCIEYKNTDIGPYNEVALSILVSAPGEGLWQKVQSLRAIMQAKFHAFIVQLPVTTELSVAGGKGLLNYPKFLADITFRETGAHRICTLRDKDTLEIILELECPKIKSRQGLLNIMRRRMSIDTYIAGQAKSNATFKMNLPAAGQAFLWPRVNLRLGKHSVAEQLGGLKIGQQIYQFSVPHCEGMLVKN